MAHGGKVGSTISDRAAVSKDLWSFLTGERQTVDI